MGKPTPAPFHWTPAPNLLGAPTLDVRFLVPAEHVWAFRRIEVQGNHVRRLGREFRIAIDLPNVYAFQADPALVQHASACRFDTYSSALASNVLFHRAYPNGAGHHTWPGFTVPRRDRIAGLSEPRRGAAAKTACQTCLPH
jgi:hypothetical protein